MTADWFGIVRRQSETQSEGQTKQKLFGHNARNKITIITNFKIQYIFSKLTENKINIIPIIIK